MDAHLRVGGLNATQTYVFDLKLHMAVIAELVSAKKTSAPPVEEACQAESSHTDPESPNAELVSAEENMRVTRSTCTSAWRSQEHG